MKTLRLLEECTGAEWTGILFHYDSKPSGNSAGRPMRLCEAIAESYARPLILTPKLIECPGAYRSLALGWFNSDELAHEISNKTGLPQIMLNQAIKSTPCLDSPIAALTLGKLETPDVVVSYLKPSATMIIIRRWQEVNGKEIDTRLSSFMAICGGVVVKAHKLREICFSFGCPDSRKYGRIEDEKLIIGMPYQLAKRLFEED